MLLTQTQFTMRSIIIILAVLSTTTGDIYFPEEELSHVQQTEPQNLQSFESYIDSVISQGTTNLCLALDRTIAAFDTTNSADYIVFSPINIASTLAIVLLGSTGKTFDEISSVLGLAYGINIANYSEPVHQQFGQLLQQLESTSTGLKQQLKLASGIFVQDDYMIRRQYRKLSEKIYQSEITTVDYKSNPEKAQNMINDWVATKTNYKIKDIVPLVPSPNTKIVIVSAIYFINEWETPFAIETTQRRPFYMNGKNSPSTVEIDQMATGGVFPYFNDKILNCEILGLPYKDKQIVFYVVIPKNSNRQNLRQLENRLNANELNRLVNNVKPTPAIVAIPKMKLTSTIKLNQILENMGLRSLFSPVEATLGILSPGLMPTRYSEDNNSQTEDRFIFARSGNVTLCSNSGCTEKTQLDTESTTRKQRMPVGRSVISSTKLEESIDYLRKFFDSNKNDFNPGLYADEILHKVSIDVTEKGTEATAATSISLSRDGNRIVFKADVPFFFFIQHKQTNMILFWGSVYVPSPHYT